MTARRHAILLGAACGLVALEACALIASLDDHDGNGMTGPDGGAESGEVGDGAAGDGAIGDAGVPRASAIRGVVDDTFVDHSGDINASSLDGSNAAVEIVGITCDDQDAIYGVAYVHTTTDGSWHAFKLSDSGSIVMDRLIANGQPYDALYDSTSGRIFGVGLVSTGGIGFDVLMFDTRNPAGASAVQTATVGGDPAFRVAFANDFLYAAKLSGGTGVSLLRFDRALQRTGLNADSGAVLLFSGTADSTTPHPVVAAAGATAYVLGDVKVPQAPPAFGATTVAADGGRGAFDPIVGSRMFAAFDETVMPSGVAAAGVVEAGVAGGFNGVVGRAFFDGGHDPSFAGDLTPLAASRLLPSRLAVGGDGRLHVASTFDGDVPDSGALAGTVAALSRLNDDGSFDTTFGTGGFAWVKRTGSGPATVRGACWQRTHGRIVVAGTTSAGTNAARPFVVAFK